MADGGLDEASDPPTSRRRGTVAGAEERSAIFEAESVSQVITGPAPAVAPQTRCLASARGRCPRCRPATS
jgi:hypothetical protein